jgi:serine/threonine-protein kinase RsbT
MHSRLVQVASEGDIVSARQLGREMASAQGFSATDQTLIATAISEIARNIVLYAGCGEIHLTPLELGGRQGIMVVARDEGPGIADPAMAMRDGFSTGKSLGMGLPGARRLMDELELTSILGQGTTVTMKKWVLTA